MVCLLALLCGVCCFLFVLHVFFCAILVLDVVVSCGLCSCFGVWLVLVVCCLSVWLIVIGCANAVVFCCWYYVCVPDLLLCGLVG